MTTKLKWADAALLLAAAGFRPLELWARNPVEIAYPGRILTIVGVAWLLGVALAWLAVRMGARRPTAVYSSFTALTLLMIGGVLLSRVGVVLGLVGVAGFVGLTTFLLSRIESHRLTHVLFAALAAILLLGPAIAVVDSLVEWGPSTFQESEAVELALTSTPDIFLVAVDSYPGAEAMVQDFGDPKEEFRQELVERGFEVPRSAWTSYWTTKYALSALFDMGYSVVSGVDSAATDQDLYLSASGDNQLVGLLEDAGYATHTISSGWSGTSCSGAYEFCDPGSFFDLATFKVMAGTAVGPIVVGPMGSPFTLGTLESMEWLDSRVASLAANTTPDFVFAHLVAPHPPFYLGPACEVLVHPERSGWSSPPAPRSRLGPVDYFIEQTQCVDTFLLELSEQLPPNTVIVIVSDHGTDRRVHSGSDWTNETIVERMNVMAAFRLGTLDCSIGDPIILPNVFRRLLSCLGDSPIADIEPRMFVQPMVELDKELVDELLYRPLGERGTGQDS